jgi:hypothetical protein
MRLRDLIASHDAELAGVTTTESQLVRTAIPAAAAAATAMAGRADAYAAALGELSVARRSADAKRAAYEQAAMRLSNLR